MSVRVFIGLPPGNDGPWNHTGGADIERAAGPYPAPGPALYSGVALGNGTTVATDGLTLPQTEPELLDQWLKVSKWSVSLSVPVPAASIGDADGAPFTLDFEVATGATATVTQSGGTGSVAFDTETPIAQDELLKGGIETRIEFSDPRTVNTAHPDAGTFEATTNREFTLAIRHGQWAWHGPLQKWVVGVDLDLDWSAIDSPAIEYDTTSVVNQPDPPESVDGCPGGYHWDGSPGTNLGNETDPLWSYGCEIDYYSAEESAVGYIDPDMERAGALSISADDYFEIGTFLGAPMWVRMDRVVGVEFWDVADALRNMEVTIDALEYYPPPE